LKKNTNDLNKNNVFNFNQIKEYFARILIGFSGFFIGILEVSESDTENEN
jgi:hypothetical protein